MHSPAAAPPALALGSRRAVDALIADSAHRGDRAVAWARLIFSSLVLVRFLVVAELAFGRVMITVLPILGSIAFSLYVLTRSTTSEALVRASVCVDAIGCFFALLPNVLWHTEGYAGLLSMPDTASLLLITFAAGFRLSTFAAVLGGGLNALSFSVLVAVERMKLGPRFSNSIHATTFYAILIGAAVALAIIVAVRTRNLVGRAALGAVRAEEAERSMRALLEGQHDMRSLLMSATLNADLLMRAVLGAAPSAAPAGELVSELQQDLHAAHGLADAIRGRAFAELVAQSDRSAVDVLAVCRAAVARVRRSFPEIRIELELPATEVRPLFAGGSVGLTRVVSNLLINACEGDGERSARHVKVAVEYDATRSQLGLSIADDGPGFSPAILTRAADAWSSTKPDGHGVGLLLVERLVVASDGSLELSNAADGGARVVVRLRASSADLRS